MSYLQRFPIDIVKIDQSFVSGLGINDNDDAIVSAIISLARAMGLDTVAEGIEELAQADELRALGCAHGQGYLYAQPLPALDLEALLLQETEPGPHTRTLPPPQRHPH